MSQIDCMGFLACAQDERKLKIDRVSQRDCGERLRREQEGKVGDTDGKAAAFRSESGFSGLRGSNQEGPWSRPAVARPSPSSNSKLATEAGVCHWTRLQK